MALKPTIYKMQVNLANSDQQIYDSLTATVALHPSENVERMTARLIAYFFQWQPNIAFTRGLSETEEPDLWQLSDTGDIEKWIDIGQPEEPRLRKACGKAQSVLVYAFGASAHTWWHRCGPAIERLPNMEIWQLEWAAVEDIAQKLIKRNMQLSASIAGGTLYLDDGAEALSLEPTLLHASEGRQ